MSAFDVVKPLPSARTKTSVLDLPAQADDWPPEGFEKLPTVTAYRFSNPAAGSVRDQNDYIAPGRVDSVHGAA